MIRVQHRLRIIKQHVYGHGGNWVTNALTMLLPLAHFGSSLATTWPRAGFVTTLTHLYVLMAVTTSVRSWTGYNTFEQMQRRLTWTGFSIGSSHRSHCVLVHVTRVIVLCFSCSQVFSLGCFPTSDGDFLRPRLPYRVSTTASSTIRGILFLELLFLEQANEVVASYLVEIDVAKIALSCCFALDLLCYK